MGNDTATRSARGTRLGLTILVLSVGASALACTSTVESAPETGPCAERSGSYVQHAKQRSGTCGNDGDEAESIVNIDATSQQAIVDRCTGEATPSADNCTLQFNVTCTRDDLGPGWTVSEVGKSTWNRDGSHGSGSEQVTILRGDGIQECTFLADLTWTRQ